jgi:hypothetical protein
MDELDIILTEQLYSAKSRKKHVRRLRKLMPTDRNLAQLETCIDNKMIFLGNMIQDKRIKPKRRINIKRKLFRFYINVKFIYLNVLFRKKRK